MYHYPINQDFLEMLLAMFPRLKCLTIDSYEELTVACPWTCVKQKDLYHFFDDCPQLAFFRLTCTKGLDTEKLQKRKPDCYMLFK